MKIEMPLFEPVFDGKNITKKLKLSMQLGSNISIMTDDWWIDDEESSVFVLWLNYGTRRENAFMFDLKIDELEMFANSVLKAIEMVRRDYAEHLDKRRESSVFY